MQVSPRFLTLLQLQLEQFSDRSDLRSLVVYLATPREDGKLALMPAGHWPAQRMALPAVDEDQSLLLPSEQRRWLPLRHQSTLLGALRVELAGSAWPANLHPRLQAAAQSLTEALLLDLEHQRLAEQLERQQQQLRLLVHQMRNPLAALRTFAQLLKRRLEGDPENRALVENLLVEGQQLHRYIEAIDGLADPAAIQPGPQSAGPLLLPPSLRTGEASPLRERVQPLLQRAAATAALQGRAWQGPGSLPDWRGDSAAVAEILANLLENAFRYSPEGSSVGLHSALASGGRPRLTVWDGGVAIADQEREAIFGRGIRGERGQDLPGTGLGLALARDLARNLGGELSLLCPPSLAASELPRSGNAFLLELPPSA
ncbi:MULTISPECIES: sensor histidine kinase KdpD [unclassified Synechococcus]|uniref:sensor histidine kinase n=1 Tax=unclassified Synechococcus TaxID=2626047 RepID=UPI0002DD3411|nr:MULTISPECIES: HAMP domain-containing sensor histidine kinase [unclassified Synechococcus]MCP9824935.1 sensor histidine kinase [Synechococcus sp. EJ6-Ellesmere]WFN59813.1 HAMP domain-containing sensor histidine kinase [Synechococcus sp. CCFWC 502]